MDRHLRQRLKPKTKEANDAKGGNHDINVKSKHNRLTFQQINS